MAKADERGEPLYDPRTGLIIRWVKPKVIGKRSK